MMGGAAPSVTVAVTLTVCVGWFAASSTVPGPTVIWPVCASISKKEAPGSLRE